MINDNYNNRLCKNPHTIKIKLDVLQIKIIQLIISWKRDMSLKAQDTDEQFWSSLSSSKLFIFDEQRWTRFCEDTYFLQLMTSWWSWCFSSKRVLICFYFMDIFTKSIVIIIKETFESLKKFNTYHSNTLKIHLFE